MAIVSIFPGEKISINDMNGIIVENATITGVEAVMPDYHNHIIYNFEATVSEVAIGNDRVPSHFPCVNLSMGECTIEIEGQSIPGQIVSYEISLPYCQEFLDSFSTRMPQMERVATFSLIVNSIDLEYGIIFPEKEEKEDEPINNRWEILDL